MATIVKRDGSEIAVSRQPVKNESLKKSALQVIADCATITAWNEKSIGDGKLLLTLECIIDRKKLRPTT